MNPILCRLFDRVISLVAIVVFCPVWLLVATLILLDDGGPILFCQTRLGLHKRPLTIVKFRSMRAGQVTRVGRWIRATGLDETLQFVLVVLGQMAVVGPRPLTEADVSRIGWQENWYRQRWQTLPGITGLAQLYSGRGADASLAFDLYYQTHRTLWLDIRILLASLLVNLLGKRFVRRRFLSWLSIKL